jgi:hypothetical protein
MRWGRVALYLLGVNFRSRYFFALGRVQIGDGLEGVKAAEGRGKNGTRRTEVVIRMRNNEDSSGFNGYADSG